MGAVNLKDRGAVVFSGSLRGTRLTEGFLSLPQPEPGPAWGLAGCPSWDPATCTLSPIVAGQNVSSLGASKSTLFYGTFQTCTMVEQGNEPHVPSIQLPGLSAQSLFDDLCMLTPPHPPNLVPPIRGRGGWAAQTALNPHCTRPQVSTSSWPASRTSLPTHSARSR